MRRKFISDAGLVDRFFFLAGGIASLAFGVLLFVRGLLFGWGFIAVLLAIWLFMAYVTLPRLHRILTSMYVPNYFIGRTRTSDGLLGDPVNVALMGEEPQVHRAMRKAGWTQADEITAASAWRTAISTLAGRSYDEAPVSPLFLFGRRQDFAYQQEVDGNPGKRHHVRFWRCPDGWLLPGGRRVDWLAAGTYDRALGLSLFTLQITHKIDENTDIERDHIVETLSRANSRVSVEVLEDFSSGYHSRNGGGDSIITDGDLPVIDVREVRAEPGEVLPERPALILDSTGHDFHPTPREITEELWRGRPLAVVLSGFLVVMNALLGVLRFLWGVPVWERTIAGSFFMIVGESGETLGIDLLSQAGEILPLLIGVGVVTGIVLVIAQLGLVVLLIRGSRFARLLLMAALLINVCGLMLFSASSEMAFVVFMDLLSLFLQIAALMGLSSNSARRYAIRTNAWESPRERRLRFERLEQARSRGETQPLTDEQRFGIPEA